MEEICTYTFTKRLFGDPNQAIEICSRMGWAPEQDDVAFKITYTESDAPLVEFIFDYFM